MSSIAERLGGSKGTLWAHFSSKGEVFVAVVDSLISSFENGLEEILEEGDFTLVRLRDFLILLTERLFSRDALQLFRMIVAEGERFPIIANVFFERGPGKMQALVLAFYRKRFTAEQSVRLTQLTIAAITGFRVGAILQGHRPDHLKQRRFIDDLIRQIRFPQTTISHEDVAQSINNSTDIGKFR